MFLCQTFYSSETLSTTIHTFSVPYKIPQNKVRIKTNREFYRYYFSFETQFDLPISFLGYGLSLGDATSLVFLTTKPFKITLLLFLDHPQTTHELLKFDFHEEIQMKFDLHGKIQWPCQLGCYWCFRTHNFEGKYYLSNNEKNIG